MISQKIFFFTNDGFPNVIILKNHYKPLRSETPLLIQGPWWTSFNLKFLSKSELLEMIRIYGITVAKGFRLRSQEFRAIFETEDTWEKTGLCRDGFSCCKKDHMCSAHL